MLFSKPITFLTLLIIFFSTSCNTNESKKESTKSRDLAKEQFIKKEVIVKKTIPKKKPEITNKNVTSFLTKYGRENPESIILMKTDFGDIKIKLYTEPALHRASFIRLVKQGFYDKTYFYRVVKDFVIQGGNSDAEDRKQKKAKVGNYTIPAEFNKNLFHKKGAIAMTRDYKNNPGKRSSSYDFYIVQGEEYSNFQLDALENEYKIEIEEYKRKLYRTSGGTPHLDGEHTVIGEVIKGLDVVEKIASVEVDRSDWPINDIYIIKIEIVK